MPFNWTPEADVKMLAAVIQMHDIKMTKDMIQKINGLMGPECKGQAVTHRFAKFKNMDVGLSTENPESSSPVATPKKRGRKPKSVKSQEAVDENESDEKDGDAETAAKRRRISGAKEEPELMIA